MKKCYIVLYTCCTSRAIHLDLVEDLSGPTFINSLRRFTALRGKPALIKSDNAKTFKFTAKSLDVLAHDETVFFYKRGELSGGSIWNGVRGGAGISREWWEW